MIKKLITLCLIALVGGTAMAQLTDNQGDRAEKLALDGSVGRIGGAPDSDTCDTAREITALGSYTFSMGGNSTDGSDPAFSCQVFGDTFSLTTWATFTAASNGSVTLSFCDNDDGDTLLAVYTGSCGNFTEIACGEDECDFLSEVTINAVAGETYYVVFADWGGPDLGDMTLTVSGDAAVFIPPIPTLGEWGLIAFVILLVGASVVMMRRQRQQTA